MENQSFSKRVMVIICAIVTFLCLVGCTYISTDKASGVIGGVILAGIVNFGLVLVNSDLSE